MHEHMSDHTSLPFLNRMGRCCRLFMQFSNTNDFFLHITQPLMEHEQPLVEHFFEVLFVRLFTATSVCSESRPDIWKHNTWNFLKKWHIFLLVKSLFSDDWRFYKEINLREQEKCNKVPRQIGTWMRMQIFVQIYELHIWAQPWNISDFSNHFSIVSITCMVRKYLVLPSFLYWERANR